MYHLDCQGGPLLDPGCLKLLILPLPSQQPFPSSYGYHCFIPVILCQDLQKFQDYGIYASWKMSRQCKHQRGMKELCGAKISTRLLGCIWSWRLLILAKESHAPVIGARNLPTTSERKMLVMPQSSMSEADSYNDWKGLQRGTWHRQKWRARNVSI